MERIEVVGLGVSTIDIVALVDCLPAEDEVRQALEMVVQGGGPVATAMIALARLGGRCAMLDRIGGDWRGALILEEFQRDGVITEFLKVDPQCTSAMACVLVLQENGARSIVYTPGSAPELSPRDLPRSVIASARFLHVNGRHWEACLQAVRWAREAGVQVSFDGGAHRFRPAMKELLPLTDVCIVARDYAARYTGEGDPERSGAMLLDSGPGLVVITDGTRGSWVSSRDGDYFHQPAYHMHSVLDTTGCGDSYHGAFLLGLLRGMDLRQTAAVASAVAALNSQQLGGRSGIPKLQTVNSFIAAH